MNSILYYGIFAAACVGTAGIISRWVAPIRLGVVGIALALAPAFPPRIADEAGGSWWMTAFAVGGLVLLAADVGGKLKTRR